MAPSWALITKNHEWAISVGPLHEQMAAMIDGAERLLDLNNYI